MTGDLQGVFLGLLAVPATIDLVVAGVHLARTRTVRPDAGPAPAGVASLWLGLTVVLVGLAWLLAVMEPVHSPRVAAQSYQDLLDVWWDLLPMVAIGSAIAGFLSSVLGTSNPLALAFWLGMPTAMYAALAWATYTLVAGWVPPGDAAGRAELDHYAGPLMVILTAFPVASFVAGLVGAIVGAYGRARGSATRPAP